MTDISLHLKTVGLLFAAILIGAGINYLPVAWVGPLVIGALMAAAYYLIYNVLKFQKTLREDKRFGE